MFQLLHLVSCFVELGLKNKTHDNLRFLIFYPITGTIVHGTIVIVMLFWRPHPESPLVFFVIAGLWGVGDAVWQTQINGMLLKVVKFEIRISNHFN